MRTLQYAHRPRRVPLHLDVDTLVGHRRPEAVRRAFKLLRLRRHGKGAHSHRYDQMLHTIYFVVIFLSVQRSTFQHESAAVFKTPIGVKASYKYTKKARHGKPSAHYDAYMHTKRLTQRQSVPHVEVLIRSVSPHTLNISAIKMYKSETADSKHGFIFVLAFCFSYICINGRNSRQ